MSNKEKRLREDGHLQIWGISETKVKAHGSSKLEFLSICLGEELNSEPQNKTFKPSLSVLEWRQIKGLFLGHWVGIKHYKILLSTVKCY
jgi:hypothetical protein